MLGNSKEEPRPLYIIAYFGSDLHINLVRLHDENKPLKYLKF